MTLPNIPTARDIMASRLITLHPDMDIFDAVNLFLKKRISGAPVVEGGRLIGILSEKDCLRTITLGALYRNPHRASVRHYMSTTVETIEPELDLISIAGKFLSKPYRRFPVLDAKGRLIGQVSRRDALQGIQQMQTKSKKGPNYGAKAAPY